MTELIWDGKYNTHGKKNSPVRIALPFQTIETVNESVQDRQRTLDMFAQGRPTEWRNRLIWGDKKYVLPSLLPEFAGKVNLIYIDPPFNVGADFSFNATIPDNPETDENETTQFIKKASIIEQKAYRDTWGKGLDSYLQWFYETVILLRELLAENGSIYVHLDWHVGHYAKTILDEIFGYENFINEIIWKRRSGILAQSRQYGAITDTIFFYSKNQNYTFHPTLLKEGAEDYVEERFKFTDEKGRRYRLSPMVSPSPSPSLIYEYKGYKPPKNGWSCSRDTMEKWDKEGKIVLPKDKNQRIQRKQYLDEWEGRPIQNLWDKIPPINPQAIERLGYDTQKPEALLDRIIKASSNAGDLIVDIFVGSGTTAAVSEKLNRRWIACDLGRFAIHTTRKRLLGIPNVKPFVVQNLGKYERQQWMGAEFQDVTERALIDQRYRHFIVQLYQGVTLTGYNWLHGVKAGRMIHVGSVDAPVSIGDVKNIVQEFWKSVGKTADIETNGVDILGWEFAFEINETAKQFAAANNVALKFKKIPTEVLEKKAVEQGDIKFYELASLSVDTQIEGQKLTVQLTDFIVPPDDVPEDVRTAITHWQQWVDYWAVDWNYYNDTFHNEWQSYRTKKDPTIELKTSHKYDQKGKYQVVVKVIDILGNDTTKMIEVEIS